MISTLASLAGYAAIVATYWLVLSASFPGSGVTLASFLLGFFAYLVLQPAKQLLWPDATVRATRRHARDPRPRDGRVSAVRGRLVALGEPVLSPLEKVECLLYGIEIYKYVGQEDGTRRTWDFQARCHRPAAVETPLGVVQLLGIPDLSRVPDWELEGEEIRQNARAWIAGTRFEPKPGLRDAPRLVRRMLGDPAPEGHLLFAEPGAALEPDHRFEEKQLGAGDTITVVGKFDEQQAALVPRGSGANEIFVGDVGEVLRETRSDLLRSLAFMVLCCAIAHAFASLAIP